MIISIALFLRVTITSSAFIILLYGFELSSCTALEQNI